MMVNPDGTLSAFSIVASEPFVLTDISIQRESVVVGPGLFGFSIDQTVGTGIQTRWAFVGSISENVERNFRTGIVFSTPFTFTNLASSVDNAIVFVSGFTE
jgi:hypothetical protein